jgi:hypothetical protein
LTRDAQVREHAIMKKLALLCFALGSLALSGCSSDSSDGEGTTTPPKPCNEDPWSCPDGQTCWATSMTGDYKCTNSDTAKQKGDACKNLIGAPTCGDDLSCYAVGSPSGVCAPFCDNTNPDKKCASGEVCDSLYLAKDGPLIHVCRPVAQPPDAGPDAEPDATPDGEVDAAPDAVEETAEDGATSDVYDDVVLPEDASAE